LLQWHSWRNSSLTVAGPRGIFTPLPFSPARNTMDYSRHLFVIYSIYLFLLNFYYSGQTTCYYSYSSCRLPASSVPQIDPSQRQ
jgi:hypothetical protein